MICTHSWPAVDSLVHAQPDAACASRQPDGTKIPWIQVEEEENPERAQALYPLRQSYTLYSPIPYDTPMFLTLCFWK